MVLFLKESSVREGLQKQKCEQEIGSGGIFIVLVPKHHESKHVQTEVYPQ